MPRGKPTNPIRCRRCFELNAPASGICSGCLIGEHQTVYHYTPEVDEAIRSAYCDSASRKQMTLRMHALVRSSGIPRPSLQRRAGILGLKFFQYKRWTPAEDDYLRTNVGTITVLKMSENLRRSFTSVKQRVLTLELSARANREGYSAVELAARLGVSVMLIDRWLARKWIHRGTNGRIAEVTVRRFLRNHLDEIHMRRADVAWLTDELMYLLAEPLKSVRLSA